MMECETGTLSLTLMDFTHSMAIFRSSGEIAGSNTTSSDMGS